jgi:hypothetical protein
MVRLAHLSSLESLSGGGIAGEKGAAGGFWDDAPARRAEDLLQTALRLDPGSALALYRYGQV